MFSRRSSVEASCGETSDDGSPRRSRRASAGEVFAPLLTLIGARRPPADTVTCIPPSNRKSTPTGRREGFHDDKPTSRRRRRHLPTDSYPSLDSSMTSDVRIPLFTPSPSTVALLRASSSHASLNPSSQSSRTTLCSHLDSEDELRAASVPNDRSNRTCLICDCPVPPQTNAAHNELVPSPCKCSFAWVHLNCLEDFREASGRNCCPVCTTTWYQGYAQVSFRRSFSLSRFAPGFK
ncbi:Aste57867_8900 [Aphanomyces stellatus]|uniref:Aste57867_8900 protein n=1 Tax=Aphanomyces stellatus TaxID=120398 RepID=A0A485KLN2_9STRA|nr:hypothetical protein As57867_008865 [Aphanomyces stellatus]VFT85784.1 Aste57867_8900 [Aphanomyces stellatus]